MARSSERTLKRSAFTLVIIDWRLIFLGNAKTTVIPLTKLVNAVLPELANISSG